MSFTDYDVAPQSVAYFIKCAENHSAKLINGFLRTKKDSENCGDLFIRVYKNSLIPSTGRNLTAEEIKKLNTEDKLRLLATSIIAEKTLAAVVCAIQPPTEQSPTKNRDACAATIAGASETEEYSGVHAAYQNIIFGKHDVGLLKRMEAVLDLLPSKADAEERRPGLMIALESIFEGVKLQKPALTPPTEFLPEALPPPSCPQRPADTQYAKLLLDAHAAA